MRLPEILRIARRDGERLCEFKPQLDKRLPLLFVLLDAVFDGLIRAAG